MSDALFRLVGDGDRHSGGAIPLPDAFSAVVNHLLDYDSADFRTLNHIIRDVLRWKEERIMASAWRSWEQFTRDILTVLAEMNLARENEHARWRLTEEFVEGHRFYLPGTSIWFVGRKKEARELWEGNEALYLALNSAVEAVKDKASHADPYAVTLVEEAGKVLAEALHLNEKPLTSQQKYYRKANPRKPHEQGKKLRSGMSSFFREFWEKEAKPGVWYTMDDVAVKFNETHPDQPSIAHGHLQGSMRRVAREMVLAGLLEQSRVMGDGAWKNVFRKPQPQTGEKVGPFVTYDKIKRRKRGS